MNFLFRSFIFFGGVLVLLLFVALLAPLWIDWEQFTGEFEEQASKLVGQPVKVGGESNLRLLPLPYISFNELEVGKNADGSPLMTVEQFSLNAELLPFLSGEVRIVEMFMLKPRINLQVRDDGTVAWTQPRETLVDPEQVNIEKLTVQSGSLALTGIAGDRTITLENFDAELSAGSVLGPWRLEGAGDIDGVQSQLKLSTGTYQREAGSLRVKIDANRDDQPYRLLADGPVTLKEDVLSWRGGFDFIPRSPTEEADASQQPLPIVADGQFELTPQRLEVSEYRLEIGDQTDPYVVSGKGEAEIAERIFFRVDADGRQIDLDQIETRTEGQAPPGLETRLAALRSVLNRIPVPAADGEIDIVLPAMVAGDTYIRDVKAVVRPLGKGWDVRALSALFPGNTALEAKGRVGLKEDFGFAGRLIVASRQPSGFAAWMSGEVSPEIRRIRAIGLDAQVTLSEKQLTLDQLELRMDDAVLNGKLQRIAGNGGKPAIIAELNGNRVNTNDLRALYSLARGENDDLVSHDLNIKVKADQLETSIWDIPFQAKQTDAHVQVRDGSVSVERFSTQDLFGATVTSGGRIENLLAKPNGNMTFSVAAENASGLFGFVNQVIGGHGLIEPFLADTSLARDTALELEVDTSAKEDGAKGQVLLNGVVGGTTVSGRVGFDGEIADIASLPLDLSFWVSNPDPALLIRQAGIETVPDAVASPVDGPLKAEVSLTGVPEDGMDTQVLVSSPGASITGQGRFTSSDLRQFDGTLESTLAASDIVPFATLANLRLPVKSDVALPLTAKFAFEKQAGLFALRELSGQVMNNRFEGSVQLETEGSVRPRLDGDLKFEAVDLMLFAEPVLGRHNPFAFADTLLPDEDLGFSSPIYPGLDAQLKITGDRVSTGGLFAGQSATLSFAMVDGAVNLNDVSFDALGGKVTASAGLRNAEGTVVANGNFFISEVDAAAFLAQLGLSGATGGTLGITGSLEGAGRSVAGIISALTGSGFARLENGVLPALDPSGFDQILLASDVEGFEINPQRVRELVDETVLTSELTIAALDAPFSVSQGQVRFRNIIHNHDAAEFSGDLEVSLLDPELNGELDIRFKPGKRDLIGGATPEVSVAWSGPLGAVERAINTPQLEGFLSLRAFEASQRRVETLEARVIEKQRLTRQISYEFQREQFEARRAAEELRRLREIQRKRAEEAARRRAEQERIAAEAERQRLADEAAKQAAEARRTRPSIETSPLEPLAPSGSETTAPTLRENIIQNLENFLNTD